ncbi:hypothetical protein [Gracilinema caldarium]|uniref:hypothetical protein n=1 Tax=Gracilinema caldarium TaxID=215591 RepID=UPI0026EF1296|nr:hypothetical protein [Gracilinema caldarium]
MKKVTKLRLGSLVWSSLIILFAWQVSSCATTSGSAGASNENPYDFIDSVQLEKGQVFYKDMISADAGTYSTNAFEAANNFLAMDNYLEFSSNLSEQQQLDLLHALFTNLPARKDKGDVRIVMVGDYFRKGSHLIILIDQVGLIKGKVPGKDFALRYFTNAINFKVTDKETKKERLVDTGKNMSTNVNYYRLAVPYDGGRLVLANNLTITPVTLESAKDDSDLGNMMDTVIKDEFPENDGLAETIYSKLVQKENLDSLIRLLAEMNYFLYQMRINKLSEAEQTLSRLEPLIPQGADPSVVQAVRVEAPLLLRLMKAY